MKSTTFPSTAFKSWQTQIYKMLIDKLLNVSQNVCVKMQYKVISIGKEKMVFKNTDDCTMINAVVGYQF